MRSRRKSDRLKAAAMLALAVLGIGYVGRMDYEDLEAKKSGPVAAYSQR